MVEVTFIRRENNVRIGEDGSSTQLLKAGLYDFDADKRTIRVFDGNAAAQINGQNIEVKSGHQLSLNGEAKLKAQKFDKNADVDDFYRWASLRSSYLAEANVDAARTYSGGSGWSPGIWNGNGWYWDPWYSAYTRYLVTVSSMIRSAGASIPRGLHGALRITASVSAMATAMEGGTSISSAPDTILPPRSPGLPDTLGTHTALAVERVWAPLAGAVVSAEALADFVWRRGRLPRRWRRFPRWWRRPRPIRLLLPGVRPASSRLPAGSEYAIGREDVLRSLPHGLVCCGRRNAVGFGQPANASYQSRRFALAPKAPGGAAQLFCGSFPLRHSVFRPPRPVPTDPKPTTKQSAAIPGMPADEPHPYSQFPRLQSAVASVPARSAPSSSALPNRRPSI